MSIAAYLAAQFALPIALIAVIVLIMFLMRPKRFYIVRHGETLLNLDHIRQGEEGLLSEQGRMQAAQVGEYLKQFSIGKIITSTYPRAKETAEILESSLKVPVVATPLLVERRNPSEVIGKHTKDPEVERISDEMDRAYHDDTYRFSDEENFVDLKKRAHDCLPFLAWNGVHETVVVTHHVFLKMLIAYMLYREHIHAGDFAKVSFFNWSSNAGITICEFHPWRCLSRTRGWEVVSFNEQVIEGIRE